MQIPKPLLVAFASVLVTFFVGRVILQRHRAIDRKSLNVLLTELCKYNDSPFDNQVFTDNPPGDAIRQIGSVSIPYLLDAIDRSTNTVSYRFQQLLNKQSVVRFDFAERPLSDLDKGELGFHALGTNAKSAVPALSNMFLSGDSPGAAFALSGIGPDAMPTLFSVLTNSRAHLREREIAAHVLRFCKLEVKTSAIPVLVQCLSDEQPSVRWTSAESLGVLSGESRLVVRALVHSLDDSDWRVQRNAAGALGRYGTNASFALSSLARLTNSNSQTAYAAISSIGQIDRAQRSASINSLMGGLRHTDPFIRRECALQLGNFGTSASDALPLLQEVAQE